jgi:hypothetical protein
VRSNIHAITVRTKLKKKKVLTDNKSYYSVAAIPPIIYLNGMHSYVLHILKAPSMDFIVCLDLITLE